MVSVFRAMGSSQRLGFDGIGVRDWARIWICSVYLIGKDRKAIHALLINELRIHAPYFSDYMIVLLEWGLFAGGHWSDYVLLPTISPTV